MEPINEGMFNSNWRKRNSAIILSGEMLDVLSKVLKSEENDDKN